VCLAVQRQLNFSCAFEGFIAFCSFYSKELLTVQDRDYTLIIDKSGSMATPDQPGGRSRWQAVQKSTLALARKCEQFDPQGITVYLFSGRFKRYDKVTSDKVAQIFRENLPMGTTNLADVLKDATEHYFARRAAGQAKLHGETILVVTDGDPDDRQAVMQAIIEASRRMKRNEELAILLILVGSETKVNRFLKILDDALQNAGAKFDIVETITLEEMENMTLDDVLLSAINA
jgi:Mg-chelatase subunit ChlD